MRGAAEETREQHSTIEALSLDHGAVARNPPRRSLEGVGIDVICEDGFSCWTDEDGEIHGRTGCSTTRKGLGWR